MHQVAVVACANSERVVILMATALDSWELYKWKLLIKRLLRTYLTC